MERGENDYIVCPPQPWLDGINAGEGFIRQFVAMPLGMGYTVEAHVTGEEHFGGIQIMVYEPMSGRFPDQPLPPPPMRPVYATAMPMPTAAAPAGAEMGLATGGKMAQKIYPDPHGIDIWDQENYGRVYVHIVNSMMFREITGKGPPPTPITAKIYADYGLPWFALYGEKYGDIPAPKVFQQVKSIKELDQAKGFAPQQDDDSVNVPQEHIVKLKADPDEVGGGKW